VTGSRRPLEALIATCSLALFAPLAWPLLTGRIFTLTDLGFFHLPMRAIYRDALRAGGIPFWTPSLFGGFYVHGEGQAGMLHPLHLLLYRTLPLGVAFNLEFLASYVAAFAGMYWWLRRLDLSRAAALFGALLFAFSGFQLLHFLHMNMVAVAAHIPLLLAAIDVVIRSDRPRQRAAGLAGVGCALASVSLAGFPQGIWWNLLAAAWFAPLRAWELGRLRRLLPCAFGVACGLALGAVQILPTLDMMRHSVRTGYTRSFALMYSLHPFNVLQLWSPYALRGRVYGAGEQPWIHELGIYSGAVVVAALPFLWIRRSTLRTSSRMIGGLAAFALITFVLALGRYGFLDVALTYLPVVGSLRAPVRYILLTQLALAALAAIVFDHLAAAPEQRLRAPELRVLAIPLALSALTLLLVASHLFVPRRALFAPVTSAAAGTVLMAAVTVCLLLAAQGRQWALSLLVILTTLDLGIFGFSYVYAAPPQTVESQSAGVPSSANPLWRYSTPENWGNRVLLKHYRLAAGYAGLFPLTTLPYSGEVFQRLAGVRGVFELDSSLTPRDDAVDRVRLLTDVRVSTAPAADIDSIDLRRTALVDEAVPQLSGAPGTAALAIDRPGRIDVDTNAPAPQLLSIGERYDEGWRATSDGHPVRVLRVDGDFLGCVVEPGAHRVELRFVPRSLVAGALTSLGGAIALACGAFAMARSGRD